MTEIWKSVEGYEGLYEVSNMGHVRSVDRIIIRKNGIKLRCKGKELYFTISKVDERSHRPRASVQLWKNNIATLHRVHRLVAKAFIPNPENKPTVNHIDGNPLNNCVENLEWNTFSENQIHAYKIGLAKAKRNFKPANSRKVFAKHEVTGEEFVCDTCRQMAEKIGVCHQRVSVCASNNEKIAWSKCKGYIIQYL